MVSIGTSFNILFQANTILFAETPLGKNSSILLIHAWGEIFPVSKSSNKPVEVAQAFATTAITRLPFLIGSANPATSTSEAYLYINGSNNLIFEFVAAGVPQCSISSGTATTGVQKLAFAYKNNDFVFYKNGVQVGVDTSGTVTSGFDRLYIGSYNADNLNLNEPIKQALVFKTRLSNADLATLTTL